MIRTVGGPPSRFRPCLFLVVSLFVARFPAIAAPLMLQAPPVVASWSHERESGVWTYTLSFNRPRALTGLMQVNGRHPFVLREAPADYTWEARLADQSWRRIPGTTVQQETRIRRRHAFGRPVFASELRMKVTAWYGAEPALAVVEPESESEMPAMESQRPWILVVNSTHDSTLPGHGQEFIPLARSVPGWEMLEAQQIWVPRFSPEFLEIEPRPLAVFFSGSFKDWCEVDRRHWRGVERALRRPRVPIWASCGGAQALAIIAESGTRTRWDCPHCRDPRRPRIPIYTHLGHDRSGPHLCGEYSRCTFERGPHAIAKVGMDPAFEGLPPTFLAMESHCGQIDHPPEGWDLVATAGPNTQTSVQCLRLRDHPVYAAQFHIEMPGTPENSQLIMSNFLSMARAWTGYRHR